MITLAEAEREQAAMVAKMALLEEKQREIDFMLKQNTRDTASILAILNNTKGLASFLKWLAAVGAGLYGIWQLVEAVTKLKGQ